MNNIDIMVNEHKYIVRMLKVVRSASYKILKGKEICYEDFHSMVDFIRSYADAHHHGKEEKLLFKEMVTHLGKIGTNLITHGMLVEHDYGRLYIFNLLEALERVKAGDEESKLDVIANAIGYATLLTKHIGKEDELVYPFGLKNLPEEVFAQLDRQTEEYENKAEELGTQTKYITLLETMEKKYLE